MWISMFEPCSASSFKFSIQTSGWHTPLDKEVVAFSTWDAEQGREAKNKLLFLWVCHPNCKCWNASLQTESCSTSLKECRKNPHLFRCTNKPVMNPIRTSRELLKTLQNLPPHHRQVFKAFQGQTFLFWHDARWIWFWNATVPVPCIHALRTSQSIQSISCWIEHISGSPHNFEKGCQRAARRTRWIARPKDEAKTQPHKCSIKHNNPNKSYPYPRQSSSEAFLTK